MLKKVVKVLVVDDMATMRNILVKGLSMDPGIEVVATATDPYSAREMIVKHNPDVVTLDIEMPRMNGVDFLKKLMPQYPVPVVMVSSATEERRKMLDEALRCGAVDYVLKPSVGDPDGGANMLMELRTKVKLASAKDVSHWKHTEKATTKRAQSAGGEWTNFVIAIGASTGGTEAIKDVITKFPGRMPPVVMVQHMPPGFTKMFSDRMNSLCEMEVKEAESGDQILPGRILLAPGGFQMEVWKKDGKYFVRVFEGPLVNGHCPSVEVMMRSVAKVYGKNAIGIMLTGMGGDGADGMKEMHDAGARTLAQNEETCVVFGMPKVAWERGGVDRLVPLQDIAGEVIKMLNA